MINNVIVSVILSVNMLSLVTLSVILLNVITLSFIILSVIILRAIMLTAVVPNVKAPQKHLEKKENSLNDEQSLTDVNGGKLSNKLGRRHRGRINNSSFLT